MMGKVKDTKFRYSIAEQGDLEDLARVHDYMVKERINILPDSMICESIKLNVRLVLGTETIP
jgi:hypothetical protein